MARVSEYTPDVGVVAVVVHTEPEWKIVAAIVGVAAIATAGVSLTVPTPVGRWVRLSGRPDGRHLPVGVALLAAAILLGVAFVPLR